MRPLLNRTLFSTIIDDDENLTYEPVLAVPNIHADLPDRISPETKLPRMEAGQFQIRHLWWS
ncbi:Protein of unknown function [Propionibacterium freudenreichii]|nr:Protein of unknown function [Propionibacterium freudenreichii]